MESGYGPGQGGRKVRAIEMVKKTLWCGTHVNIEVLKHILKFSNCVLVRVPINNNNYEQPLLLFKW